MMLIQEAKWFDEKISKIDIKYLRLVCNVGSSDNDTRSKKCPWIDEHIFSKIKKVKGTVKHIDIKKGGGVDIVGDFDDYLFLKNLEKMKFTSIFCTNLLEHIKNKERLCRTLTRMLHKGGYLFVSCPYKYPQHKSPIDNMFRPKIKDLSSLFPNMELVAGEIINGDKFWDIFRQSPTNTIKTIVRASMPFYKPKEWFASLAHNFIWFTGGYKATCAVLRNKKRGE